MTAPLRSMPETITVADRYEVYRVVLDYEAMFDGFHDRIEDLNTTLEQVEMAGGFAKGVAQKLLCRSKGRSSRTFGWESLGKMLKGTGLALVLVVDDERFAPLKEQLATRRRKPPAIAGSPRPTWLFTKRKARKMGKRRFSMMTEAQIKRHQRKAGKASGRARRLKARASALLAVVQSSPCADGQSPPITNQDRRPQIRDRAKIPAQSAQVLE